MKFRNPDHATRAIIEAAKTKLKHAANLARGKSAFWYLMGGGVGGGALLAGAGILCGGYSYIVGNEVIARQVAESVKAVLDKEVITTKGTVTGEVSIKDGGEVALAKGGQVSLDPNSQLVRVSEQVSQAATDDTEPTWQTVYKVVWFGSGRVQSYASFRTSTAQKPFRRRCIYFEDVGEGLWRGVLLESNGQRLDVPNPSPFPAVDLNAAAAECVNLTNLPAQAVAPVAPAAPVAPVKTIQIHAAKR
jgi:hypothetical protein